MSCPSDNTDVVSDIVLPDLSNPRCCVFASYTTAPLATSLRFPCSL